MAWAAHTATTIPTATDLPRTAIPTVMGIPTVTHITTGTGTATITRLVTATATTMTMTTADPHLTLHQLFSPAFPVGAFAYSHGLETCVQAGQVADAATLQDWLETVLEHGAGWSDAVLLAQAAQFLALAVQFDRLVEGHVAAFQLADNLFQPLQRVLEIQRRQVFFGFAHGEIQ